MTRRHRQGNYVEYGRSPDRVQYGDEIEFLSTAGIWVIPTDPEAADDNDLSSPFITIHALA